MTDPTPHPITRQPMAPCPQCGRRSGLAGVECLACMMGDPADLTPSHDEHHGRVWDTWGGLSAPDRRRIRRRHPQLGQVLDEITDRVRKDLAPWLT